MGILECSNFFLFDRADSVILKQIEKKSFPNPKRSDIELGRLRISKGPFISD